MSTATAPADSTCAAYQAWRADHPACRGCGFRHGSEIICPTCHRGHSSAEACFPPLGDISLPGDGA